MLASMSASEVVVVNMGPVSRVNVRDDHVDEQGYGAGYGYPCNHGISLDDRETTHNATRKFTSTFNNSVY